MEFDLEAAARLPPNIRFGTSSWKYPGWKGTIYRASYRSKRDFEARCLEEYATFPWFRAVGLDASFYRPPSIDQLERYAGQVPAGFAWVAKVWDRITVPRYGRARRYGDRAGKDNPDFLDPVLFREAFLPAFAGEVAKAHTGPFVFQFQSLGTGASTSVGPFLDRLDRFLSALPQDFRYGIEVRSPELLVPRYFKVLNDHGASHCFNHWSHMPPLVDQMRAAAAGGGIRATWYLARLLTPLGMSYEQAVGQFQPYDRLQTPQPEMRRDVLRLVKRAMDRQAEAWILVNNRIEGNSPSTIDAIGRQVPF